jgi:glycosyltransferase involved in cell wall biosynthesis
VRVLKTPIILARLHSLFKRYPPDIVHAHSAGGYAWTTMASGFRPYIVTPWGTDLLVDVHRSRINRWLTGLALRHAALVTTDGLHFVEILRRFGVAEKGILVHTFGTDIHHFCPGPDEGERQVLGVGEAPLVISTRTLNPVHDVETFVRALPAIHAVFPPVRFVIVGGGTDRMRLEALATELGMCSVTCFTGMVEEERMRRLLRASDVYVSTSKMDAGLAASTAEAMAIGLPVVQTYNSDNAYWTPNGEGGLLVANGDSVALSAAVIRLLGDAAERRRMGERNRQMVVKEYNMDTEMSRIENEYKRLAGKSEK